MVDCLVEEMDDQSESVAHHDWEQMLNEAAAEEYRGAGERDETNRT